MTKKFRNLVGRREFSGTVFGLGMQKVIERHGGRSWIESDSGNVWTHHFSLPKSRNQSP